MTETGFATDDFKNQNQLLYIWENFEGKIDCEYTKRLWNAEELICLSKKISYEMKEFEFSKGDIVAVLLTNTIAFPAVLMALLYLECNPLLLNAATPEPELERMAQKLPIKYFIRDFIEGVSRFTTDNGIVGSINIDNITMKIGKMSLNYKEDSSQIFGVILHPTSGTYGEPAICMRNQRVAVAEGINYISSIDVYKRIRIMITTPLSHAFGYGFGLISSILTNSELVISPVFNPKKVLRTLTRKPCEILTIVPPMIRILIMLKEAYMEFGMANKVFFAGAHCNELLMKNFEDIFDTTLYGIYGSTETGAITTNYTAEAKLAGVGKTLKNVSVMIKNMDKYSEIGTNIGEVYVKASSMMQGYYNKDLNSLQKIKYFFTGDLGLKVDENMILKGRIKDIINVNGMKVDGREIENIILGYPGIKDAVVYPGKDANNNEIVLCAFCVKSTPVSYDSLREYCVENLAYHKVPRAFYLLNELPRTPSGKCIKIKLPGYI